MFAAILPETIGVPRTILYIVAKSTNMQLHVAFSSIVITITTMA